MEITSLGQMSTSSRLSTTTQTFNGFKINKEKLEEKFKESINDIKQGNTDIRELISLSKESLDILKPQQAEIKEEYNNGLTSFFKDNARTISSNSDEYLVNGVKFSTDDFKAASDVLKAA